MDVDEDEIPTDEAVLQLLGQRGRAFRTAGGIMENTAVAPQGSLTQGGTIGCSSSSFTVACSSTYRA